MLLLKNKSFRRMALMFVLLVFSTSLMAANVTIKAKNESLKSVLEKITQQTGYEFAYSNAINPNSIKVNVEVTNQDSDVFFKEFFSKYGIVYKVSGKTISLSKQDLANQQPQQKDLKDNQNVKISGVVLDENGASLPGVYVMVKGTKRGTTTDITGKYELDCTVGEKLQYSCMGFKNVEMTVGKSLNPFRNVVMAEDLVALEEAVVIGYGSTQKIKDITGSISHVGAKVIEQQSMGNSIASVLQGKAAGVNVMIESASPTAAVSVLIRGQSSLSGSNQPLWVVDGVPQYDAGIDGSDVANVLYSLNLNDVESIDILKDASSTAIYGSRAANGVVVVTTKSSKDGMKPILEFSSRIGIQIPDFNDFEYFNAAEYREFTEASMRREAYFNGNFNATVMQFLDRSKFWAMNTSEWSKEDFVLLPNAFYDTDTDWMGDMLQNPIQQQYDLSFRGGVKNLNYLVSMSYKDNRGVVKSGYNRMFTGRIRLEATLNKNIKMRFHANGSTRNAQNKDHLLSTIRGVRPDLPAFNEDGSIYTKDANTINPYSILADKNFSTGESLTAGAEFEFTFLKDFKFSTSLTATYSNSEALQYNTSRSLANGSEVEPVRQWSRPKSDTKVWTNTLLYNKSFGKHNIFASLSASMEKYQNLYYAMSAKGFPDNEKLNSFSDALTKNSMNEQYVGRSLMSQIGRVQYNYGDRYLATFTLRRDGSSRFGKDRRWGWFPSFGLGWTITNEEFFKNWNIEKIVSFIKFRASYGKAGSQNLSDYQWMTQVSSNMYNDALGLGISSLGNPTLRWEETIMTDVAMDMEFWNSRIRASVGYFEKKADDLIYNQSLPLSSSFSSMTANIASTTTKGYEFSFDMDVVKNSKWQLTLNFNGAHQDTWVDALNNTLLKITNSYDIIEVGEKTGRWYGYKSYGRLIATQEEVTALKTRYGTMAPASAALCRAYRNTLESPGDIYLVDVNGDGTVNTNDCVPLGTMIPKLYGGFGLQLYIGNNFNIGASFSYSYGNLRFWASGSEDVYGLNNRNHSNKLAGMSATLDRNSPYNPATMPNNGQGQNGTDKPNDFWLFDASYIRLNGINARYRLGKQYFRNTIIDNLEFSLQANNLFTLTKYPGFDPQGNTTTSTGLLSNMGMDYSTYPSAKTFTAGVKITFR